MIVGESGQVQSDAPHSEDLPPLSKGAVETVTIATMTEYATFIANLATEGAKHWFRGVRDSKYDLRPSLYRHETITAPAELLELEWLLLSDFRHQAPPFIRKLPDDNIELLFLMQHYRVPTRLLDWSENPFIALFFALENAKQEDGGKEKEAAVWVLDPAKLNATVHKNRDSADRIFGAYTGDLEGYRPSGEGKALSQKLPCAVYGIHNSPRIVAQRGSFVMYGKETAPIEDQETLVSVPRLLRKLTVPAKAKRMMFEHLFNMGISDSVVYPDLDGLGREIRNRRGF
ncbi:FRG domain-containing protein [Mesorhizobium caraganae]|uniref:FRG domain-containing protein n=1 Tax=Mesorhizobium caraganae TaxID=483206 RepID=UPI00193A856D|nr:FRG domain-containing protein [Mesorhizobium caraganae]MBM2711050.1 FRG domain-containing protein [Mesorhizobium caraganae]